MNELRVNLNNEPQGLPDGSGFMWQSLGAFSPNSNTLTVKLRDDDNNGKLLIDAIRLVEVGPVTQTDYDCNGNLVRVTDPLNHVTQYEYDDLNRLIARTDPDPDGAGTTYTSSVTLYAYNAVGWLTSLTDPEGNVTFYQYDALGRRTKEVKVTGAGLTGEYGFEDEVMHSRTDATLNFAAANDFADFTDLPDDFFAEWSGVIYVATADDVEFYLNSTDHSELYVDGVLITENDGPSGMHETSQTVDLAAGWHTLKVAFQDTAYGSGSGLVLSYDIGGGKVVVPNSALFTTATVEAGYDAAGRLATLRDASGNVTSWQYDEADRVTSERQGAVEEAPARSYQYDGNGNLTQKTDRNGRVTTYQYDHLDRVKYEKWYANQTALNNNPNSPLRTTGYEYDEANNLAFVSDPNATYVFGYDALNRETLATHYLSGLATPVDFEHAYDAAGRMTSASAIIDSNADYLNTYSYDTLGRLTRAVQAGQSGGNAVSAKRVEFGYDAAGQKTSVLRRASATTSNSVAASDYFYDQAGRLTTLAHTGLVGTGAVKAYGAKG